MDLAAGRTAKVTDKAGVNRREPASTRLTLAQEEMQWY
jgi:hypothetical protein